ncbi:MAG: hypothetical protein I8H80_02145 [Alphaproteobacteria bacterium]|nr:hypothetical protein [Alphaproteobacteria bacterium]
MGDTASSSSPTNRIGEEGNKDPIKPDSKLIEEFDELNDANANLDGSAEGLKKVLEEDLPPAPLPNAPAPTVPLSDFEKFSAAVSKLLPTTVEGGVVKYLKPPAISEAMKIGLRDFERNARGYAKTQELLSLKEKSLTAAQAVYDKRMADLDALRVQRETVSAAYDAVMSGGTTQEKEKAKKAFLKVTPFMQDYEVALMQASDVLKSAGEKIATDKKYLDDAVLKLTKNTVSTTVKRLAEAAYTLKSRIDVCVSRAFVNIEFMLKEANSIKAFPKFEGNVTPQQIATFFIDDIELFKTGNLNSVADKLYAMLTDTIYRTLTPAAPATAGQKETLAVYLGSTLDFTLDEKAKFVENFKAALKSSLNIEAVNIFFKEFMPANDGSVAAAAAAEEYLAAALSSGAIKDLSGNVSLRTARTAATGLVDGSAFKMNGVAGQSVELGLPLFVQLKGDVSSAKATDAATGSVAYRLGNTVIGAIQGYANSGAGFGIDSRQLETSVVASHSFGSFFVEGQIGSVSATEVHNSNWSGLRSQVTLGLDTEFVSPFVQLTHRQLDRGGLNLNETTAYVGLDAEVAKLAADTYSIDTRLLAKAGYGSKDWSAGSKDLGSTTGFSGSVEWSSSLNLNSGVSFSSNLSLDTVAGSSAALNVSLDR